MEPSTTGRNDMIGPHMSMKDMFDLLLDHGCVDLASKMDAEQDTAMVMSGGGFGDIWMGKMHDGVRVAIKAWRASAIEQCDYKTLKHATHEIHVWSRMKHRNIHQLMGVIMFKGKYLGMVSEWMENGNLHEYMRKHPNFDRYQICVQITSGLAYMHQNDVVHGDLKSLNVLVSSDGVAKLSDFGLSTMSEGSLAFSNTSSGQAGSTRWAAPELLMGDAPSSKQTDVYALGNAESNEIFTGAVPYSQCQKDFHVMRLVQQATLPTRPNDQLNDNEKGNRMWDLLVGCWSHKAQARPSAMKVLEMVSDLTGLNPCAGQQSESALGPGNSESTADKSLPRRSLTAGGYHVHTKPNLVDERVAAEKRSQTPQLENRLEVIDGDRAEEHVRLLSDLDRLDQEVYEGLILGLKIPSPTSANAPSLKAVLFPAQLISLISNEMWRYGMIKESERFLSNTMLTIQGHVMSFTGEDAIVPGVFWLSNVHEILSFICYSEAHTVQGIGPTRESLDYDWPAYQHLIQMVKSDLDSLEYNIYHWWMVETKKHLSKMIIPAIIENQAPGFIISKGAGRLLNQNTPPAYNMDDVLNLLNKVLKSLKCFFMEESVVEQVVTELLKLVSVTSFNDLLMRRNFCSWERAMHIQYNIMRIEEWCKSHAMPEGALHLEHMMQVTKLLQLMKATPADVDMIYDVCWILTPSQIQRICANYFVADYESSISPEIMKLLAQRVQPNDRTDHLMLTPENEDVAPYEPPLPREVASLDKYVPGDLNIPHIRRLAAITP
ncbi:hypothetical protein RSAG8_07870, partial [Rhizoctonia solani AG-8 WAC10335]